MEVWASCNSESIQDGNSPTLSDYVSLSGTEPPLADVHRRRVRLDSNWAASGLATGQIPTPVWSWRNLWRSQTHVDGKTSRNEHTLDRAPEEWEDSPEGYPQAPPYDWWIWHDDHVEGVDRSGLEMVHQGRD